MRIFAGVPLAGASNDSGVVDDGNFRHLKVKGNCIAVHGTPSHSGVSLAIWDHTVLPSTRHKWTHPAFTTASQAGSRFTYPGGMEGWVDLGDLLHTEMVYPPADGHLFKY